MSIEVKPISTRPISDDIRGERILFEDALHQLDDAIPHIGVERLHLQYPML